MWDDHFVNYLAAFELVGFHPNVTILLNDLATIFVLYGLNFLIYFWANMPGNGIGDKRISIACPLLLLFAGIVYQSHRIYQNRQKKLVYGLLDWTVLNKMMRPGCVNADFRAVFCSDVFCSMTRLITDAARGACWVLSGSFLTQQLIDNYGSDYMRCTSPVSIVFIGLLQAVPLWIRLLQCLRQNNRMQFLNAGKYCCSISVVLYEVFKNPNETNLVIIYFGHALKVLTVFVVWWWDVKMDFGLWDVPLAASSIRDTPFAATVNKCCSPFFPIQAAVPTVVSDIEANQTTIDFTAKYWGLRDILMYGSPWIYYSAIVLDFIFRSLWVISLTATSSNLVGPQLNFLLCTLEITRRCGWGLLRVEKEHIKRHELKQVGFVQGIGPRTPSFGHLKSRATPRSRSKAAKVYLESSDDEVQPFETSSEGADSDTNRGSAEQTPRHTS
jgi:hypothetical protein